MSKVSVGEAFSVGLGVGIGMIMSQQIAQAMKPSEKLIKQIIICHVCGSKNPVENKFCGQGGHALYPPPPIQCPRCTALMPSNMKFCGRCGSLLQKTVRTRKRKE